MHYQSQVREKMQHVDPEGAEQRWLAITPQCTDNIQGLSVIVPQGQTGTSFPLSPHKGCCEIVIHLMWA